MSRQLPVKTAVGLIRDRMWWMRRPDSTLRSQGIDVLQNWLPIDACRTIQDFARSIIRDRSYWISEDAYFLKRGTTRTHVDTKVSQVMNAHLLEPTLAKMAADRVFEVLFEKRLDIAISLETISIQIDEPDTRTKRGFHVDRLSPPSFKAFVYLTDVIDPTAGPYTVIPCSHKHVLRKAANTIYDLSKGLHHTDQPIFYSDTSARCLTGEKGTCILSSQQLAHKGWHDHRCKTRYMVVAYLQPTRWHEDRPFRLGAESI